MRYLASTVTLVAIAIAPNGPTSAHDFSLLRFLQTRRLAQQAADGQTEDLAAAVSRHGECKLTVKLLDAKSGRALPGLVRISRAGGEKYFPLPDFIRREMNWYSMPLSETVSVPQTKLTIEAFHGLETAVARTGVDLTGKRQAAVELQLSRFYDAEARGLRSGNTHLHLMRLTHAEAYRYLQTVPKSDGLDLVYLSHLRRVPDERHYISNLFTPGDLQRLSQEGVLFDNGEEHRHNFGGYGEGYGHVMFLHLLKLIEPVSIGPGIMREGTDGIPLQRGIKQARDDGATVIWCHNKFGLEDIPNWLAGALHAQNIFDGGTHGSYDDTFYRYLNLGMKVPFSTGTDWFVYDFSRVYVPVDGPLTSSAWLRQLAAGRSYITNGTFLEFQVDGHNIGDTIALDEAKSLRITARGIGRNDFGKIELIHNGIVVHSQAAKPAGNHFAAAMDFSLPVDGPGWLALRIPPDAPKNEFGKTLYAHTSPIYLDFKGRRIFDTEIARQLTSEVEQAIEVINDKGVFAGDAERTAVLQVHHNAIAVLRRWTSEHEQSKR